MFGGIRVSRGQTTGLPYTSTGSRSIQPRAARRPRRNQWARFARATTAFLIANDGEFSRCDARF